MLREASCPSVCHSGLGLAGSSAATVLMNWDKIAYLLRYSLPLLYNNFKTDAELLLPYLALARLRHEKYADRNLLLPSRTPSNNTIVIDVGAYTGEFATRAMEVLSTLRPKESRSLVIAVEPNPSTFQQLSDVSASGCDFCSLNLALSSESGDAAFVAADRMSHLRRPQEAAPHFQVEQRTLDGLRSSGTCGWRPSDQVFILKIDSEGHDGHVLLGARETLMAKKVKFLLFEHTNGQAAIDLSRTLDFLWTFGYACFMIQDRFLVPVSHGWFHPMYRDRSSGGFLVNADFFCADVHDPDLSIVIEGFVTHSSMLRAKEIALTALAQWQKQVVPQKSVWEVYDIAALSQSNLSKSILEFYLGDLLRVGYGAKPTAQEMQQSLEFFKRSVESAANETKAMVASVSAYEVACCYYFGDCATRDRHQALHWYRTALRWSNNIYAAVLEKLIQLEISEEQKRDPALGIHAFNDIPNACSIDQVLTGNRDAWASELLRVCTQQTYSRVEDSRMLAHIRACFLPAVSHLQKLTPNNKLQAC
ncbi:unnamed protein product [Effrenium voratum]|nr:unnamed protein product [Effrenium voratum]